MRLRLALCSSVLCILTFFVGLLVGQQRKSSKFDKYLAPANISFMDFAMIQANLDIMRDSIVPTTGVEVPIVDYDAACHCIRATAIVSREAMEKSVDDLKGRLLASVIFTRIKVKRSVADMSDSGPDKDFKMTFKSLKGQQYVIVAEYGDGQIVLK